MYRTLGNWVAKVWPALLVGWVIALSILVVNAPAWNEVVEQGEFAFLPADSPSLSAERLYEEGWGEPIASNIVIVIQRERTRLDEEDREFIQKTLKPKLVEILEQFSQPATDPAAPADDPAEGADEADNQDVSKEETPGERIKTFASESSSYRNILDSADGRATMVVIELKTEFFDASNAPLIHAIERLIAPDGELYAAKRMVQERSKPLVPEGLRLALSGSATVGRDLIREAAESSKATEFWTVLLVIALLIIIYRSPVLALIPLITVAVATEFSLALLTILAENGWVGLFNGIEVYVKVLCYGAGVDYCLFLIARFKEELDALDTGDDSSLAVSSSIGKVGDALVASACTVMCGIGMMVFADFGKFRQAGVAITVGLAVVLLAALTFTPALLRLCGRWAFWPHVTTRQVQDAGGWLSANGLMGSLLRRNVFDLLWKRTSDLVVARPGFVLTVSTAVMLPFAVIAVCFFNNLSYGLLTELPQNNASVQGARAVQQHYPAGIAGPVTILLQHEMMDFNSAESTELIGELTSHLYAQRDDLKLADIRSRQHPFGIAVSRRLESEKSSQQDETDETLAENDVDAAEKTSGFGIRLPRIDVQALRNRGTDMVKNYRVRQRYVAQHGDSAGHITRLDFLSVDDPFSRDGIEQLVGLQAAVRKAVEVKLPQADLVRIYALGPTPSMRDLKSTTDRDQLVVDSLVLVGVFLILLLLLKQIVVCSYLIVSVFFSYLVTLGVTFAVFWLMDPSGFSGLDWKVPTFLFTILIAVGEDYNIFLMTRIREEQVQHGPIQGVAVALQKTGSIISSCGIIMAGTFSSLLAGTLVGMHQLGFALAFGVLLDTFVVRPILVPAFLVLLYEGRFRELGHLLGFSRDAENVSGPALAEETASADSGSAVRQSASDQTDTEDSGVPTPYSGPAVSPAGPDSPGSNPEESSTSA